ncbi:phosphoglycerate dehydrogenase [Secundilactobacillus collinoides]|uniref:D-3-phosphoglycerate dehydrogenase n=2 Tax=Secundilactobacillus collinoides TaxID=33960 RepID=A0A0R2B558_SECCO|nr:phosphoglycerate dehydrogenase [Secundilactobacillus collinoides]KRM74606.1 D-3-phosphoglycerate dehydrogenase [Secundilactobacillus collinoides DSM 20515 = JCM 1123]KZL41442.1 3-phosphoglycerate dehydrogenase [Secundilactobacillus collinoides]
MTKKVIIPKGLSQAGKDYLTEHHLQTIELKDTSAATILSNAPEADGIVLMTEPFPNDTIAQMPNLKVIARHGVGYDNVDQDYMQQHNIWVTITPNANASTVAETTLAEMLDLSKNLTAISDKMRTGDFDYKGSHMGFDLAGKKLGIMGYGRIGRMVAHKASALGMTTLIYDPFVKEADAGTLVDRDTLFKEADIITLHMAVTPENTAGIGQHEFELMKSSAVIINLGRGALVDQNALIQALKNKTIRGAALDVFNEEPLPLTSPFYTLDNVLLTPHIASNTVECMSRMAVDSASEVVRVLSGEKPEWPVNQI